MFRRIVFVAALAGLIAGLVASGLQALRLVPLIHQAEPDQRGGHRGDQGGAAAAGARGAEGGGVAGRHGVVPWVSG